MELSSTQRKALRGLAHHIDPLVLVGQNGVTPEAIQAIEHAISHHELIKVRFNEFKEVKKDLVTKICQELSCGLAGIVGHIAILYRPHSDPQKRKIKLPKATKSSD